jgi:dTMP kinase
VRYYRHNNPHGLFVVVEGIDGTGKTTLARNIYIRLREGGFSAIFTFEPTDGLWEKN